MLHILNLKNRLWTKALILGVALGSCPVWASDAETTQAQGVSEASKDMEDFVLKTGNDIIQVLVNKAQPMSQRKADFRGVLHAQFDMKGIGRFVLSRAWRTLDANQKAAYLKLFEDAVVENYASQFDNYHNEKLTVKGSYETKDGGLIVHSKVLRPAGGPPLKVDWKIFKTKDGFRVLDIVVDGVSMSITLRTEYMGVFQDRGGYEGLISYLKNKITQNHATQDKPADASLSQASAAPEASNTQKVE